MVLFYYVPILHKTDLYGDDLIGSNAGVKCRSPGPVDAEVASAARLGRRYFLQFSGAKNNR